MRRIVPLALALFAVALAVPATRGRPDDKAPSKDAPKVAPKDAPKPDRSSAQGFVRFRVQEIDRSLKVGYAVITADVNGDGKPDIVVVDTDRVFWYENPGAAGGDWKRHVMIEPVKKSEKEGRAVFEPVTKADNVCIAAGDVDGDGKVDFVLGAGWKPFDSKVPGTLQWLRRGKSLDEPWEIHPIPCDEPTVHRVRFADVDGSGKPQLIVAPIMGQNCTMAGRWTDGRPVRLLAYPIPADPVAGPWKPDVINESLHVVHNIAAVPAVGRKGSDILAASFEGVTRFSRDATGLWSSRRLAEGFQESPLGSRGCSEVCLGKLKAHPFLGTIEPWHGNRVVVYTPTANASQPWDRNVVDSRLRWGHAVWTADLDGDGVDELIVGVRDDPGRGDEFSDPRGVRVYRSRDAIGKNWERQQVDSGGVAVEDLTVADLDGDGRPDIVAVGRQTANVRIYWNQK
jgi:hypothetical protein